MSALTDHRAIENRKGHALGDFKKNPIINTMMSGLPDHWSFDVYIICKGYKQWKFYTCSGYCKFPLLP